MNSEKTVKKKETNKVETWILRRTNSMSLAPSSPHCSHCFLFRASGARFQSNSPTERDGERTESTLECASEDQRALPAEEPKPKKASRESDPMVFWVAEFISEECEALRGFIIEREPCYCVILREIGLAEGSRIENFGRRGLRYM
jgi:hypothetical protein